ncbi:unnamed protein product [Acanthoscelides obtectus]|uniref:Uncharacterized protein n=1 Tax=Acanthoscelides obtectus TaxID=200917 RepID=A0A9P0JZI5_ACAOB|nr:unnamed protein product [Acanthoscelides obtectus]CAK1631617.1 hypothetical protein AOBTE_LOCUS7050 [Acanthoscelides obtectus]
MEQLGEMETEARRRLSLCRPHLQRLRSLLEMNNTVDDPSPKECMIEAYKYLRHCEKLVDKYKERKNSELEDEYISKIDSALKALEFDSNSLTIFKDGSGEGTHHMFFNFENTELYKLLHGESRQGLKKLMESIEQDIHIPMKKFLEKLEMVNLKTYYTLTV